MELILKIVLLLLVIGWFAGVLLVAGGVIYFTHKAFKLINEWRKQQ